MSVEIAPCPVLVYIPDERGLYLASEVLRCGGFDVRSVASGLDLAFALGDLGICVVVTVTSMIGEVRALANVPVINIQAFVLPNHEKSGEDPPALFDRQAFLERVRSSGRFQPAGSRYSASVVD